VTLGVLGSHSRAAARNQLREPAQPKSQTFLGRPERESSPAAITGIAPLILTWIDIE